MFQRILVALEPTVTPDLLPQALDIAQANQATLMFVHVSSAFDDGYAGSFYPGVDTLYPTLHSPVLQSYAEAWNEAEERDRVWLRSLVNQAHELGLAATMHQRTGDPGPTICQIARDEAIDLILVGRRGRSGLSEMLLGSVSNYVMHHAPCSVLTVQGTTVDSAASAEPLVESVQ